MLMQHDEEIVMESCELHVLFTQWLGNYIAVGYLIRLNLSITKHIHGRDLARKRCCLKKIMKEEQTLVYQ